MKILAALRQAGIAHGDLQHGNILVNQQGKIKLIDYDGMYVPALAGFASNEKGHSNYQHPARNGRDFGPYLDGFPGWVILVTLSALTAQPALWNLLTGGDECLLFRENDFRNPAQSKAFQTIATSQSPEIQALGIYLRSLLSLPLNQIPSVDTAGLTTVADSLFPSRRIPDWLKDHIQQNALPDLPPIKSKPLPSSPSDVGWLVENLAETSSGKSIWQGMTFLKERIGLLAGFLMLLASIVAGICGFMPFWTMLILALMLGCLATGTLWLRYKSLSYPLPHRHHRSTDLTEPLWVRYKMASYHADFESTMTALSQSKAKITDCERRLRTLQEEIHRLNDPLEQLRKQFRQIPDRYERAETQLLHRRNAACAENDRLTRELEAKKTAEVNSLDQTLHQESTLLRQQAAQLDTQQKEEFTLSLKKLKGDHIWVYLHNWTIADAELRGIGSILKERLQAAGIQSAADVDYNRLRNVDGIGEAKAREIADWAGVIRQQAESSAPATLSPDTIQHINEKYDSARRSVQMQMEAIRRRIAAEKQVVLDQFAGSKHELVTKRTEIEQESEKALRVLREDCEKEKCNANARHKELYKKATEIQKSKEKAQHEVSQELFRAHIEVCRKERELMRFQQLSFPEYIHRIVGVRLSRAIRFQITLKGFRCNWGLIWRYICVFWKSSRIVFICLFWAGFILWWLLR